MAFLKEKISSLKDNKGTGKNGGESAVDHDRNDTLDIKLKHAMRRWAKAVAVITAGEGESQTGATVTSALLFSLEPAIMLISINRSSSTYRSITKNGHFCVNVLNAGQQSVAERFSGMGNFKGRQRYEGAEWYRMVTGALALTGALATIDCKVDEIIERYSHALILGGVVAADINEGATLVYRNAAYGQYGAESQQAQMSLSNQ